MPKLVSAGEGEEIMSAEAEVMPDVDELERAKDRAGRELSLLLNEKSEKQRRLYCEAKQAIDNRLAEEYDARVNELRQSDQDAEKKWYAAKIDAASTDKQIGERRIEWSGGNAWNESKPTGKIGIVEVVTFETEHPSNYADYSKAKPGDLVIRILKADGSPSKKYVAINEYGWRPDSESQSQERA